MKAPDSDSEHQKMKTMIKEKGDPSRQLDQLGYKSQWKELKSIFFDDPVLRVLRPKLIGSLCGPVSTPGKATNLIDASRMLTQLLKEAGFTLGDFDAEVLFDCGKDRIMTAAHTLFEKLSSLVGNRDQVEETKPTIDTQKEYLTGS